jgi:predicted unusual protein kinase regulating ubiquinone biosynthesis (AarF/ABC1/UbiB family)
VIDFGMVGRLSPQRRAQVIDLLGEGEDRERAAR